MEYSQTDEEIIPVENVIDERLTLFTTLLEAYRLDALVDLQLEKYINIDNLAVAIQDKSTKPTLRELMNKTALGSEFRKAGNSLQKPEVSFSRPH